MSDELHSPRTADAQAPVVVRFGAVGDMVLLTVLLEALAQRYGRGVHLLASGAWTPVLLGHDPAVAEIRLLSSRRAPYWLTPSQWAAVRWLRAHRGPIYLCDPVAASARFVARAALPPAQVVRAWDHRPDALAHFADWWLQVARLDAADCPGPDSMPSVPARPRLHVPAAWRDEASGWLRRQALSERTLVLVQPGNKKTHKRGRLATAGHDKHWPAERWAQVVRGVWTTLPDAAVLVCGSDNEAALVQQIVTAAGSPPSGGAIVNVAARQPSLALVAALAAMAHSMISVDTGPAHVAGAMDCPLVVLYASAGSALWKPRAATSDVIALGPVAPSASARLTDLSAAQVLDAWRHLAPRIRA